MPMVLTFAVGVGRLEARSRNNGRLFIAVCLVIILFSCFGEFRVLEGRDWLGVTA
jgi:hypothetical protein